MSEADNHCSGATNSRIKPLVLFLALLETGAASDLKNHERWMELCELASKEQDPNKLMELSVEINRLLDEKRNRLKVPKATGNKPQRWTGIWAEYGE
jgi:hypothetical protein